MCKDCYIVRRGKTRFVYCKSTPKHKQRQGFHTSAREGTEESFSTSGFRAFCNVGGVARSEAMTYYPSSSAFSAASGSSGSSRSGLFVGAFGSSSSSTSTRNFSIGGTRDFSNSSSSSAGKGVILGAVSLRALPAMGISGSGTLLSSVYKTGGIGSVALAGIGSVGVPR